MYGREGRSKARLPTSHYFVSIARGDDARTLAVRPLWVWGALALIPLALLWGGAATAYVAFHDDILAALIAREAVMQTAYEQRLSEARAEIDRVASRQLLDQTSFEGRMHDLLSRQARLEQHGRFVEQLASQLSPAGKANALGAIDAAVKAPVAETVDGPARAYAPITPAAAKPHPVDESKGESLGLLGPGDGDTRAEDMAAAARDPGLNAGARLGLIDFSLDRVERGQLQALSRLETQAHGERARLGAVVARTGLSVDQLTAPDAAGGVGGPYVPANLEGGSTPFEKAALRATREVALADTLRRLVRSMPVREPLIGGANISSPFGYRIDPFLGKPALHPGVDLVQPFGSDIHATGAGRVVHAGWAGGYGQMVEIDHGNGIATRYGHMSEVLVSEGDVVKPGETIGHIGTTGRSSGPHLHYEVRLDGEPVNPSRFLEAGAELKTAVN